MEEEFLEPEITEENLLEVAKKRAMLEGRHSHTTNTSFKKLWLIPILLYLFGIIRSLEMVFLLYFLIFFLKGGTRSRREIEPQVESGEEYIIVDGRPRKVKRSM
ncbi:MAG: hypothetical protein ABH851_00240 [Methanobacteriota archaeon]